MSQILTFCPLPPFTGSRKTTLVVVGVQDLRQTRGESKSSKHRTAEALVAEGAEMSIIGEDDFLALVAE